MYKIIILLLLATQISFSQKERKTSTYKYGHNGMELIVNKTNEIIIISTFNSKFNIKQDLANKIYDLFKNTTVCSGDILTILGEEAKVIGKCEIKKKGKLTAVNFYYQSIECPSGLFELYKKV